MISVQAKGLGSRRNVSFMLPKKMRLTKQRKVILDALCSVDTHPTADQIYEMVRQKLPKISLGTVYRNLEILSELGVIKKIETAGQQRRYDGNTAPHWHIYCLSCGKVADVSVEFKPVDVQEVKVPGFQVLKFRGEFVGICKDCLKRTVIQTPGQE